MTESAEAIRLELVKWAEKDGTNHRLSKLLLNTALLIEQQRAKIETLKLIDRSNEGMWANAAKEARQGDWWLLNEFVKMAEHDASLTPTEQGEGE